ncbi:EF-P lysine aminoacylase EpmA [Porticoccaceae bacterium]|nr:EF-P lysine aminoacylase EpmA [Porticoccaceae bacterium]MDC0011627.1 EF-P lysine aminoacylase EpmA [Porticoccaceae bacterium]
MEHLNQWQPGANMTALRQRSRVLSELREFFQQRQIMEVDLPLLSRATVTDLNIDSIEARNDEVGAYLQTSPEYFMKRLLASGSGDIYSLGKAFRDAESGRRHNPEFTLLEWYRCGWDEHQLMDEVVELIATLVPEIAVRRCSYAELFIQHLQVDPHLVDLANLQNLAVAASSESWTDETRANCLDLLFSVLIEPQLDDGLVLVYDYPACQAALAKCAEDSQGRQVSRRFEGFLNRVELANGYCELTDVAEQESRFTEDQRLRKLSGKAAVAADQRLLAAMESGLPECAGVAMGVDRLLMQLQGADSIDQVMAFSWKRC